MEKFRIKAHSLIDKVFMQRVYSTIALFALMGALLFIGTIAIEVLLCLLALVLIFEWVQMCKLHTVFASAFMALVIFGALTSEYIQRDKLAFGVLFISASFSVLMSWFAWQRRLLWIGFGILYIGVPILSMLWICENVVNNVRLFWWIIVTVASNDIFAYLVGSTVGGPKLIPEISPKKTWSGFAGGIVAAVFLGYFAAPAELPKYQVLLASLIIAILANLGDFFESFIKRVNHVKDSGTIIPGHGGLFDRVDGFLLVFPFVAWICLQSPSLLTAPVESPQTTQLKKELQNV
jgi:phosphatidate cytidylyltransferase